MYSRTRIRCTLLGNKNITRPVGPDGLWIMDLMDLKSIKSIIHMDYGFFMDFLWIFNLNPYGL